MFGKNFFVLIYKYTEVKMLEKLRFWERQPDFKFDTSKTVSFKGFESFEQQLACFKKNPKIDTQNETTQPQTDIPSYYYPNIKVVKYGIPPQDVIRPMYAVPDPEIIKDEDPPLLKYAVPPILEKKEDENEPPVLKYAIPQ